MLYLMLYPIDTDENSSDDEGNEYVLEGGDKSNNDSSPTVHVGIPEYWVQKIIVNWLKDRLRKIKNLCMVQKILME